MLWLTCIWNQDPSGFHSRIRGTFSATFWCWKLGLFIPPSSTGFHLSFLSVFFAHSYTDTVAKQLIVTFFASHFLFFFFFQFEIPLPCPPAATCMKTMILCWSWSSNTLTTWFEQLTHGKRPWCWERLKAEGEEGDRGDSWMASLIQWTWVWANSGR